MERRPLGSTGIEVSVIALGCWPITGMTSVDVNETDSLATIESCFDLGINFLDTAYCYGIHGESEQMIARVLAGRRDEMVLATKGGIIWEGDRQARDASPAGLRRQCEESLRRLKTDRVELLYVHAPDPDVPISETAGGMKDLLDAGLTRSVGVSNFDLKQLKEFAAVCPLAACQPPYNMLMRDIEADVLPWCRDHNVSVMIYWPLMKGLLAGKLPRDHVFQPGDGRARYPMFQGDEWEKNQDLVDRLRDIAAESGHTVAQLVIRWTLEQPGVTAALCGAKRAWQNCENAGAAGWMLSAGQRAKIAQALRDRGQPVSRGAV